MLDQQLTSQLKDHTVYKQKTQLHRKNLRVIDSAGASDRVLRN
jgi:hypothetical protein